MISIIVLMYNEEVYIIEALESIKYQIEKFGQEEVQLILTDDGSSDHTVENVEHWLNKNGQIFSEITRLYGAKNEGTCKKYEQAINSIHGEQYIVLDGDDIFSSDNLFARLKRIKDYEIYMNAVLLMEENGQVITEKKQYWAIVFQGLVTDRNLYWLSMQGSPVLNGAYFSRKTMTNSVLCFMTKFRLLDDRSRVYKIAAEQKNLKIGYDNTPITIGRKHEASVSSVSSPHLNAHNIDLIHLYSEIINEQKSAWERLCVKMQRKNVKYRGQKNWKSKLRFFTPYYFYIALKSAFNCGYIRKMEAELCSKASDNNKDYILLIKKRAKEFREAIDD